jgi:hypothetical protein
MKVWEKKMAHPVGRAIFIGVFFRGMPRCKKFGLLIDISDKPVPGHPYSADAYLRGS